ncbi:GtrA family protein [Ottowia caeni]|uniref:GtrA family protein n=1 Tax=Ottowia caeni TaxID=2870339 RepID=UPI003D75C6E4
MRCLPSRQFLVYSVIGACGASLDFLVFAILLNGLGAHYLFANMVGTVAGIVMSFFLNRHFNFRRHDRPLRRFAAFFVVGLLGLGLSSVLLSVGVAFLGFREWPVKLFSIVVVALFQYVLNRRWSFAPRQTADQGTI